MSPSASSAPGSSTARRRESPRTSSRARAGMQRLAFAAPCPPTGIHSALMAEQATSTRPDSTVGGGGEIAELRAELAQAREEVLRLRDLLIGKEAELGALRGRIAE